MNSCIICSWSKHVLEAEHEIDIASNNVPDVVDYTVDGINTVKVTR